MKNQHLNKRESNGGKNLVATVAIPLLCFSVSAQAAFLSLEGPVSALVDDGDGTGSITVMGVTVDIPLNTPITSPTATLSITQAANPANLPGRTQDGFLGGTAIITGEGDIGTGYTADSVFLEPAENILGAAVTSDPADPLTVGGVSLEPTDDARIPHGPFNNAFGFAVDPDSVPAGTGAVSEGYLANNGSGIMKYFAIEVEAGDLVNAGVVEVSIIRAQCIPGDPGEAIELKLIGSVHGAGGANAPISIVTITSTSGATNYGSVLPVVDVPPLFANYDFRVNNNASFTICPSSVTATYEGVTAEAPVD